MQACSCAHCGGEIPGDASTRGLCPKCLLRGALSAAATSRGAGEVGSVPPSHGLDPPLSPAELSAAIAQFEILELIGQSGMGAVYRARQTSLGRLVAVKVMGRRKAADPEFEERFEREARTLARLNHPRIVSVYDYGQVNSLRYIAMELVEGGNLRQLLRRGRFRATEALAIGDQVCDALEYAHRLGIVHRDIKPENILIESSVAAGSARSGAENAAHATRVKIVDFGLARLLQRDARELTLTGQGHALGTPLYMAPEQLERPWEIDCRADIYSLGVVLYEMLTGELPLGHFDPVSQKADVDPRLDRVVLRCLEKDPARRYADVAELRRDLAAIAVDLVSDLHGARSGQSYGRRGRWLAGTGAAVAALAVFAWLLPLLNPPPEEGSPEAGPATVSSPSPQRLPELEGTTAFAEGPAPLPTEKTVPQPEAAAGAAEKIGTAAPAAEEAPQILVELSRGRATADLPRWSVRVDYSVRELLPADAGQFRWVVESRLGPIGNMPLLSHQLLGTGELRGSFWPLGTDDVPATTYLVAEGRYPGSARRRVSNVLPLETNP